MINQQRVLRIKQAIYGMLVFLFLLPFILTVVIFFSIMSSIDATAGTLGRLEAMMADSTLEIVSQSTASGESEASGDPSVSGVASKPDASQASSSASSVADGNDAAPEDSSEGADTAVDVEGPSNSGTSELVSSASSGVQGQDVAVPEEEISGGGVSAWTGNPDSGR